MLNHYSSDSWDGGMVSSLCQVILWLFFGSLLMSDSNRSVADDDISGTFQCVTNIALIETYRWQ